MHLSLSVEDTNKLRKQLGLKLIPTEEDEIQREDPAANRAADPAANEDLAARLARAAERLDSRKKVENENPIVEKKPLSTNAWLDKMRAMKAQPPSTSNANEIVEKPAETPKPKTEISPQQPLETSTVSTTPRMYNDPLQAPSEAKSDAALRMRTPKAIFKPKKLKGSSKPRKRDNVVVQLPQLTAEQEEETLANILTQSRKQFQQASEGLDQKAHIFKQDEEKKKGGVTINNTASIIRNSLRTKPEDKPMAEPSTEAVPVETEEEPEQSSSAPHSTHLGGVADLLKQLHEHTPKPAPTSKSRDWARKLAQSRLDRVNELERANELYKSLPPKEREEALKLHQQQLAQDQIREAREVATNYKPAIDLDHHDEFGNPLDTKQAFKKLSRAFHENQKKNQQKREQQQQRLNRK